MPTETARFFDIGPFRFDAEKSLLLRDGRPVSLSPKASQILSVLVKKYGVLVEKQEILDDVWGHVAVEEGSVAHYVSELRKVFREASNGSQWIETIPWRGYRFVGPARAVREHSRLPPEGEVPATDRATSVDKREGRALPYRWAVAFGCVVGLSLLGQRILHPPQPRALDIAQLTHDGLEKEWVGPVIVGDQVYFSELDGTSRIARIPANGGETEPVPAFAGFDLSDVSPDGSQILATKSASPVDELWILPARGGTSRYLGLHGEEPAWSPDADRIAYHDGKRLLVARTDRGDPQVLLTVQGRVLHPRWSPGGRVIRFAIGDTSGAAAVWEIRSDGTGLREMPPEMRGPRGDGYGRWTADGRWFVFERMASDHCELWARKERCGLFFWECGKLFRLTQGPTSYARPFIIPNGKGIIALGNNERGEVDRYDLKSNSFIPFAALAGTRATEVYFSKDRKWMAYRNLSDHSIWRCKIDGSEKFRLTAPPLDAHQPHWSPDGKQIAFITEPEFTIRVVSADGGSVKQLAAGNAKQGVPTWSPDGGSLVYGEPLSQQDPSEMHVHILNLSSARLSALPGSNGLWTARWSPDGRFIAALVVGMSNANHSDSSELKLFDFITQRWTTLATAHYINELTWSRDSEFVYFDTTAGDVSALYRVRIANRHLEKITTLQAITRHVDNWSGVAPDGSPLIVKDTTISEIYALDVEWP